MQLYVVRHGIAVEGAGRMPDSSRPLTDKGRRRFQKTARAFGKLGGRIDLILSSPLVRAVQTAEILAGATDHREVGILEELDPRVEIAELRSALASRAGKAKTIAIVGHEPQLSSLLAALFGVAQADIDLKKGAIVRLDLATLTGGAPAEARWWLKPKGARAKGLPLQGKAKAGKELKAAKGQHGRKKERRAKRSSSAESAGAAVLETHHPVLGGAEA